MLVGLDRKASSQLLARRRGGPDRGAPLLQAAGIAAVIFVVMGQHNLANLLRGAKSQHLLSSAVQAAVDQQPIDGIAANLEERRQPAEHRPALAQRPNWPIVFDAHQSCGITRGVVLWLPINASLDSIPLLTAAVCMVIFTTIAAIDGLYFHLHKYRLHERPASRLEHQLHTMNVVIFVPQVYLLFWMQPRGLWLWLALLTFIASLVVEFFDVLCEPASRADLGGLTGLEYLLHFMMAGLRFGAVLPLFVTSIPPDWALAATSVAPRPLWFLLVGAYIGVPAIGIAALHVVLLARGSAARI